MLWNRLVWFGLIILFFGSCATSIPQSLFLPHEGNTLKLKEKDDFLVSGGFFNNTTTYNSFTFPTTPFPSPTNNSIRYRKNSLSLQAAYSPIKHLGVFGSHSRYKASDADFNSTVYHKSHLTGIGAGTYYFFQFYQRPPDKVLPGRKIKYTRVLFDLYGGYTLGKLRNWYFLPEADNKMNFQKFYIQGGIHWEGTYWKFSYTHKVGRTNFFNGIINGKFADENESALQAIINKNNLLFQEPSVRLEGEVNGFGIYGQLTGGNITEFRSNSIPNPLIHLGVVVDIQQARKHFSKIKAK